MNKRKKLLVFLFLVFAFYPLFNSVFAGPIRFRGYPLHAAIWKGDVGRVRRLISSGCYVETMDEDMRLYPLHLAVYVGNLDVVKALLRSPRIDTNIFLDRCSMPGSALQMAVSLVSTERLVKGEQLELVRVLLKTPGTDVNAASLDGMTPLHQAILSYSKRKRQRSKRLDVEEASFEIIKELLKSPKIDVNLRTSDWTPTLLDCLSPLDLAIELREPRVVEVLLKMPGIDVKSINQGVFKKADWEDRQIEGDMLSYIHRVVLSGALRRGAQRELSSIEKKYEPIFKRFEVKRLLQDHEKKRRQ